MIRCRSPDRYPPALRARAHPLRESRRYRCSRPRDAIDVGRAWIRGEVRMGDAHRAAFQANAAVRRMPIQRSSLHCRQARRLRWLTSPPMTWALRRTPSERPGHASQPTTLRKLGPRNGSGSGSICLPPSVTRSRRSTTPERHLLARRRRLICLPFIRFCRAALCASAAFSPAMSPRGRSRRDVIPDKGRVILAKLAPTGPKHGLLRTYKLRAGARRGENDVT